MSSVVSDGIQCIRRFSGGGTVLVDDGEPVNNALRGE